MRRPAVVLLGALLASLTLVGSAAAGPPAPRPEVVAGERVLSASCEDSGLPSHNGFQSADPQCVHTDHGEIPAQDRNPQLLIVSAPEKLRVGEEVVLSISTRNLIRDRFLPAGAGGYYLERSHLNGDGLTRGHFHVACRLLGANEAPAPARQDQFVAVEDNAGGVTPDTVQVKLKPFAKPGQGQCLAWAGDGSHRTPLMSFANMPPAFDSVRLNVQGRGKP